MHNRYYERNDCWCPESDIEKEHRRRLEKEQKKKVIQKKKEECEKSSDNVITKGLPHDESESSEESNENCTPGMIFMAGTAVIGFSSILTSSLSMILKN